MNLNSIPGDTDYYQKFLKYTIKMNDLIQTGGSNYTSIIDLTNIKPNLNERDNINGMVVYANYDDYENKKFSPMFLNPLNAANMSPTNSIHLVIPGLLPAANKIWLNYPKDQIFYMPNDLKPHFHGEAQHHMPETMGFEIDNVFSVKIKDFVKVPNKKLEKYRKKLSKFNMGKDSTPIETWIHWRIPYNQKEYPKLVVKKNSIIWWDFNNTHNLNYVSKKNYENNISDEKKDILFPMDNSKLQIKVTIMDQVGTFYFLCSIGGHAEMGHKIIIQVVD